MEIRQARVYDDPRSDDGTRVLVDRLWPRGLSRERAQLDEWLKEVAPSTGLRRWYAHDPERRDEFVRRYREELGDEEHEAAVAHLRDLHRAATLTLLTATRDLASSAVPVLAEHLSTGRP
jgi:uncharacterized protein YeaO (DUF488 family)